VLSLDSVDVESCMPVVVAASVVDSVVAVSTVLVPSAVSPWLESCALAVVLELVSAAKSLPSEPTGAQASTPVAHNAEPRTEARRIGRMEASAAGLTSWRSIRRTNCPHGPPGLNFRARDPSAARSRTYHCRAAVVGHWYNRAASTMSSPLDKTRALAVLLLAVAAAGCQAGAEDYELRIYGEAFVEEAIPAAEVADGWEIEFSEFVVAIGEVAVVADDVVDVPGWSVYDITAPSAEMGQLVAPFEATGELRSVKFRIGRPDEVTGGNASAEQVALLQDRRLALFVTGVGRRDGREVSFEWGLPMEYGHDCELGQDVAEPREYGPTIFIHADHLLIDDLEHNPQTRFDLIASADANADDIVTPDELAAVELAPLERYQSGSREIPDYWNYIGALAGTLGHIDGEGDCTPELVPRRHLGRVNPHDHADGSRELYVQHCASCHGDAGHGDGPAGTTGWPRATDLTRLTAETLRDDYLFFRLQEGGAFVPYNSTMLPFADVLSEDDTWRVIAYVQSLAHGS
jgi:cytochrome c553